MVLVWSLCSNEAQGCELSDNGRSQRTRCYDGVVLHFKLLPLRAKGCKKRGIEMVPCSGMHALPLRTDCLPCAWQNCSLLAWPARSCRLCTNCIVTVWDLARGSQHPLYTVLASG